VYSNNANIEFMDQPMPNCIPKIQNLNFPEGGTNFDAGLQ
jgi:hypothetical protein